MRALLLSLVALLSASGAQSQRLMCKPATLAALKPKPELTYECDAKLNDWDEKILKLPARVAAIKTLVSELSSYADAKWWAADVVNLSVCDFAGKAGTL